MAILVYLGILVAYVSILLVVFGSKRSTSILVNLPVIRVVYNSYRIHDFCTEFLQRNGGTFRFKGPWFTGMNFLMTCDPMNLNYFLNTNFGNYQKGDEFRDMLEPLRNGILAADSDEWRNQRKTVQSLFHDRRFKAAIERTVEQKILNGLFPVLENASQVGNVVDLQDIFQRLTLDNICLLIVGFDPNCLSVDFPEVGILKAFHDIEVAVLYRHILPSSFWKLQRFLQMGKEKSLRKAWKISDDFVAHHITRERHKLSNLETDKCDDDFNVLTYFLTSTADEENGIPIKSDKFLSDMAFNLLTAGRDTIAAALVWFFWVVATHPSVEKKILEEMKATLQGPKFRIFKFDQLNKLIYLHAVICEVLRLYPSVPFNHIVSIDKDTLPSGHRIPGKLMVLYSLYSTGRMEGVWGKDCLEFKPERWISKKGEVVHVSSSKFIAFNTGPRSCLGKNLTFNQIKGIATAILWNYRVHVVQNYPAQPATSVVLYMRNGFNITLSKR